MVALDPNVDWAEVARRLQADPTQDPAYAAYLRQFGIQNANIRNEIQARTEAVQRAINRNAAGFEQEKSNKTRDVALGYEERGFAGSGFQQQEQIRTGAEVDYRRQQSEAEQTDSLAGQNRAANNDLNELAQRRAEEEMQARTRIGQKRANQQYNPTALA
jgi:6-phosphofructokinase